MLELSIKVTDELFNEETEEFIDATFVVVQLEHSLKSVAQWESKWKKPFLTDKDKSPEETLSYYDCMVVSEGFDRDYLKLMTTKEVSIINEYIEDPMTAVVITNHGKKSHNNRRSVIYAEVIYSQMFQFNIPMECQHWHLNRLLSLIQVCAIRSNADDKMPAAERNKSNAELNAARKQQLNTKG